MKTKEELKTEIVKDIRTELSEYVATLKHDPANAGRLLSIALQIQRLADSLANATYLLD